MRKFAAFTLALLLGATVGFAAGDCTASGSPHPTDAAGWTDLVARDFSNVEPMKGAWSFDGDGCLVATQDVDLVTKGDYADFALDLEFKMASGANAGVYLYASDLAYWNSNHLEIQLMDDSSPRTRFYPGNIKNCSLFGHQAPTRQTLKPVGEWNRLTVYCQGKRIRVAQNGAFVLDVDLSRFTDAKVNPDGTKPPDWHKKPYAEIATHGRVGLQGCHGGIVTKFRNVRIRSIGCADERRPHPPLRRCGILPHPDEGIWGGKMPPLRRCGILPHPDGGFEIASELSVVVPEKRLKSEETAARELVAYVEKVTGVRLSVVTEDAAGNRPALHLGATAFVRKNIPDLASFGDEEWTVRTLDGNLVIAGGRPRGVLYGVYHFLEDVLGIRWLTQNCEHVPAKPRITLAANLNLRGKPAMPYRSIEHVLGDSAPAFLARNRMNVEGSAYGGGKVFGGAYSCHTLYLNLGTADEVRALYKAHPDWFPLIDGRRYCHVERADHAAQSQLCLTNPDLRKHWVEKMRARIRSDRAKAREAGVPDPMYYAIDQNDCADGFCTCPECAAILKREGSRAGLLLDFVNHVAAELESEAPHSRFQMMALHSTEKPPKFLKARRNVTIRLCDTTSNELVPWTDSQNAPHYGNLKAWCGHADAIAMWDYQITYGSETSTCLPTPNERTFAADLRALRKCRGDGIFFEHERAVTGDFRDLKVWLECKLAENPDLDDRELVRTFTDLYYGPDAGAAIRAWRERLGAAADKAHARVSWYPSIASYSFITADVLRECLGLRARALEAVKGDAERTARVEHAFMSLDRYCLARASALRRIARTAVPPLDIPETETLVARTRAIYERETKAREMVRENNARELPRLEKFLAAIGNMRDLPVPEKFKSVDREALFLIPATFTRPWYQGVVFVDDPESPAGRALTLNMRLVNANPNKDFPRKIYDWPLVANVLTMNGYEKSTLHELPARQPKGYYWYKLADNLKLKMDSSLILWPGGTLPLDGVVSDNAELGQQYDIYVSVKIDGPDVFATEKVADETVYFFDQVAVIRKTVNR